MNDSIHETVAWINKDKISFIRMHLFVSEMEKYGISIKFGNDESLISMYKIEVQRRNINSDLKIIAKYIQEHNIEVESLTNDSVWIMFVPEFYAIMNGIEYTPTDEQDDNHVRPKYDASDLRTLF